MSTRHRRSSTTGSALTPRSSSRPRAEVTEVEGVTQCSGWILRGATKMML